VRNDATGGCDICSCMLTPSGEPDLPTGFTHYRVIALLLYAASILRSSIIGFKDGEFESDALASYLVPVRIARGTVTSADGDMFFPAGHGSYRDIEIRIFNLIPDVDNVSLFGHVSTDASTWKTGVADYGWYKNTIPVTTGVAVLTTDNSDSELEMAVLVGSNTNEILNGKITIPDHNNANAFGFIQWDFNHVNSGAAWVRVEGRGMHRGAAGAILGFRLLSNNADNDLSFDYEIWGYPS
jgi:hypothetical protein